MQLLISIYAENIAHIHITLPSFPTLPHAYLFLEYAWGTSILPLYNTILLLKIEAKYLPIK